MKVRSNLIMAMLLGLAISGQVYAEDNEWGPGNMPPPPRLDFTSLDSDSDGELTYEEFLEQEVPMGDHERMFSEMDSDGDGIVSEEEFESFRPGPPPHR
jgi:hypothetical protein